MLTLNSAWYWLIWETGSCVTLSLSAFILHQVHLFTAQRYKEKFHGYPNPDLNPKETPGCAVSRAAEAWRRGHTVRSWWFPGFLRWVFLFHHFIYFHCDTLSSCSSWMSCVQQRELDAAWERQTQDSVLTQHVDEQKKCLESTQELSEQTNKSAFFLNTVTQTVEFTGLIRECCAQ